MASTTAAVPPILGFARALATALDKLVAGPDLMFLSPADKKQALIGVSRQIERLDALRHRLLAVVDDAAAQEGAASVTAFAAHHTRRDYRRVRPEAELAVALEQRWRRVQDAWAAGLLNGEHAAVIVEALDKLPATLTADQRACAEEHLVALAAEWSPHGLRTLATHLWQVIAPEDADAMEAEALAREESAARAATRLSLHRVGDGSTRITGRVPDAVASRLRILLDAYTSPRRDHLADGLPIRARDAATGERLRPDRLRGLAFCTLVEHADTDRLPHHGSTATAVMVTMTLDQLRAGVGSGLLPDGSALSPGEVRRLACTAGLVPVVLDSESEPLDLGRTTRLFSPAQQRALRMRDQHCRAEGCTIPAAWTEAHHLQPWSHGGATDLDNGVLFCAWHHHRAHDPGYDMTKLPNGDHRFHRRM